MQTSQKIGNQTLVIRCERHGYSVLKDQGDPASGGAWAGHQRLLPQLLQQRCRKVYFYVNHERRAAISRPSLQQRRRYLIRRAVETIGENVKKEIKATQMLYTIANYVILFVLQWFSHFCSY